MNKEEVLLKKRLEELSRTAFNKSIPVFTDFLNLNEQNILHSSIHELYTSGYKAYGGYESAERQMVAFIPDAFCHEIKDYFPIQAVKLMPAHKKYADALNHRDFLGAVLNLGIDRGKIGDILVMDNEAVIFCHDSLAGYLISELERVKHTVIRAEAVPLKEFSYKPQIKLLKGSVASLRMDAVLTVCCKGSRREAAGLIAAKKVFVNGRLVESNSHMLKEQDIISIRGTGRFVFGKVLSETKKGRFYVEIEKYI